MANDLASRIRKIEKDMRESQGKYADILVTEGGDWSFREPKNFLSRNFSGELFWKVQIPAGVVSMGMRTATAFAVYGATGNFALTALCSQLGGGVGYIGSYVTLFFPNLKSNKEKYGSRLNSMKASAGYLIPDLAPNIITLGLSVGASWGLMEWGLHPALAAALGGTIGPQKLINIMCGTLSSNALYKYGGSNMIRKIEGTRAYQSINSAIKPCVSYSNDLIKIIGQYAVKPFRQ